LQLIAVNPNLPLVDRLDTFAENLPGFPAWQNTPFALPRNATATSSHGKVPYAAPIPDDLVLKGLFWTNVIVL
jgi:hypothetical protein